MIVARRELPPGGPSEPRRAAPLRRGPARALGPQVASMRVLSVERIARTVRHVARRVARCGLRSSRRMAAKA